MVKDPFCFYIVYDNSSYTLEIGLYKDGVILKTWEELEALGLDITQDYSTDPNDENYYLAPNSGSAANVLDSNNLSGELVVPNNTSKIGDNAFADCQGLTGLTSPNNGHVPTGNVSIPSNTASVGSNAFGGTGTTQANIPSSTKLAVDAFADTPAAENNKIYMAGHPIQPIVIDLENADSASVTLEKGYVYQIVALYNFNDDVTGESTIESSDENIVLFIPDCLLRAVDKGHAVISGTYITQLGIKKHAEIDCNVVDNGSGIYVHIPGETTIEDETFYGHDEVTYCIDCGEELSRNAVVLDAGMYNSEDGFISWDELLSLGYIGQSSLNYGIYAADQYKDKIAGILIIPSGIIRLNSSAFSDCTNLNSVYLPDSVTDLTSNSFAGCTNLSEVRLSEQLTTMTRTFGNTKLTAVKIPDSFTSIGEYSFNNCTSLVDVQLSKNLQTIYKGAFSGCTSLPSITFPVSLTRIYSSFYDCTSLTTINYEGTTAQWGRVTKTSGWNSRVPAKVVHCSDGDVSL